MPERSQDDDDEPDQDRGRALADFAERSGSLAGLIARAHEWCRGGLGRWRGRGLGWASAGLDLEGHRQRAVGRLIGQARQLTRGSSIWPWTSERRSWTVRTSPIVLAFDMMAWIAFSLALRLAMRACKSTICPPTAVDRCARSDLVAEPAHDRERVLELIDRGR